MGIFILLKAPRNFAFSFLPKFPLDKFFFPEEFMIVLDRSHCEVTPGLVLKCVDKSAFILFFIIITDVA